MEQNAPQKKRFTLKRVPKILLLVLAALVVFGFAYGPVIDKTDYPFVNDPTVIGKWQAIDFVEKQDQFTPEQKSFAGDLYLSSLVFIKDGQMLFAADNGKLGPTSFTWTQGLVLCKQEKTASKYEIQEINGAAYMFFEWKSGDYTYLHRAPQYYVLKKVDNDDYSNYKPTATQDKIDYPFVDDPQLLGQWQSVDFVPTVATFVPGTTSWRGELFLKQIDIAAQGEIAELTSENRNPYQDLTWTKGLILDKQQKTASQYEIKELKGDAYLFYQWKSGDYIYRGMEPQYYVLKKVK
ncbi:MAG TPA: hypothetical protein VN426_12045 [Syntrophomonadaceae bacterium]|nr:hypothetical protein [Syntrophomonadaceae bacterium]